jgi:predicted anti-sigma-YlaC factor YlaD
MEHQSAKELLSQYLDHELDDEQTRALSTHLESCPSCREELDALKKTLSSLAGLSTLKPPEEFVSKVQQRIRRRSRGRFFTPENLLMRVPFEWISFVIIILMLLMYFMLVQSNVPQVRTRPPDGSPGTTRELPRQPDKDRPVTPLKQTPEKK